jgi:hypothetical protein
VIAGTYPLIIELNEGSRTRIDYVRFEWQGATPINDDIGTWAKIKSLYR